MAAAKVLSMLAYLHTHVPSTLYSSAEAGGCVPKINSVASW
jgi:hypothetical protein